MWLLITEVGVDWTKMAKKELVVLVMLLCCLLVLQQTNIVVMNVYSRTYVQKRLVLTQIMDSNRIKHHKRERTKILGQTRYDEFMIGQFHEWCGGRRRKDVSSKFL